MSPLWLALFAFLAAAVIGLAVYLVLSTRRTTLKLVGVRMVPYGAEGSLFVRPERFTLGGASLAVTVPEQAATFAELAGESTWDELATTLQVRGKLGEVRADVRYYRAECKVGELFSKRGSKLTDAGGAVADNPLNTIPREPATVQARLREVRAFPLLGGAEVAAGQVLSLYVDPARTASSGVDNAPADARLVDTGGRWMTWAEDPVLVPVAHAEDAAVEVRRFTVADGSQATAFYVGARLAGAEVRPSSSLAVASLDGGAVTLTDGSVWATSLDTSKDAGTCSRGAYTRLK